MSRPSIGAHYSNDDERLYRFARRAEPPWYPPRGWGPDALIMILSLLLALASFAAVYFLDGGL